MGFEKMQNLWVWFVILGALIGALGYIYYPQQQQSDLAIIAEQYGQDVIDVVVFIDNLDKALEAVKTQYEDYQIVDQTHIESKNAWAFRLVKEGD